MAKVYTKKRGWYDVLNLGWLLRRADIIELIVVYGVSNNGCHMCAFFSDKSVFYIKWADATVCKDWLSRPSLKDTPLFWENHWTEC